jgi:hypothetical protein
MKKEPKLGWLARLGLNIGLAAIKTAIAEIKDEKVKDVAQFSLDILEPVADILGSAQINKGELLAELFKTHAEHYAQRAVGIALRFVEDMPPSFARDAILQLLKQVKF